MKWWELRITVFNLQLLLMIIISEGTTDCQVQVSEPWPVPYLFAPRDSTIRMNCTALNDTDPRSPIWSIDMASDDGMAQLQFGSQSQELNEAGLFKIDMIPGTPTTVGLLINNTAVNNQTVIYCNRRGTQTTTTLFVFSPGRVSLDALDVGVNSIRLEWNQESLLPKAMQSYSLTVSNVSSSKFISPLYESHHNFTAPEGAPPCQVYNFSVTTIYINVSGATYTGAGCSVPSPVLSTMLPSLPKISQLESSLDYVLKKQATELVLRISFEPASYCENYPIINYTLEVNNTLNEEVLLSGFAPSTTTLTVRGGLSENAAYSFRILVANTVGVVSTTERQFITTDVQAVTATFINSVNMSTILCEFLVGSNAKGCMVVLTSGGQEAAYNLTKRESVNCSILTVTLVFPQSHIDQVEAFDIKANGSVSSLAIPGLLSNLLPTSCTAVDTSTLKPPSSMNPLWVYIMVVIGIVTVLTVLVLFVLSVAICRASRGITTTPINYSDAQNCPQPSGNVSAPPVYQEINDIAPTSRVQAAAKSLTDNRENIPHITLSNSSSDKNTPKQDGKSRKQHYFGVSTDGVNTIPNVVYGVSTDVIKTTPNVVYGIWTDGIETTPNAVYGVSIDGIEMMPNKVYGIHTA